MGKSIRSKFKRKMRAVRRRDIYGPIEDDMLKRIAGKLGTIAPEEVPPEVPKRFSFVAPKDADHDEKSLDLGLQSFKREVRRSAEEAAAAPAPVAEAPATTDAMEVEADDETPNPLKRRKSKGVSKKRPTGLAAKRKGSSRQLAF